MRREGQKNPLWLDILNLAAPQTWAGSMAPATVGLAIAWHRQQRLDVGMALCLYAIVLLMQSAVNAFDDYADFVKGTDTLDNSPDAQDAVIVYGMKPKAVMRVANDAFILAWRAIDPSLKGRIKSYFAFQAVSAAVPWWPAVKKAIAGVALACLLSGCEGCWSLPGGDVVEVGGVDVVQDIMDQYGDGLGTDPAGETEEAE